jgi:hypothetical protein
MTTHSGRGVHIAIAEANNFHEETIFALVTAARQAAPDARLTVFAPDHWESRSFLLADMRMTARWLPFAALGTESAIDLLLVNTFPSPAGQPLVEANWRRARAVLGLVHNLEFFGTSGAAAALHRHPNLTLAYVGPTMPDAAAHLEGERRAGRVVRWLPVLRPGPAAADADGAGQFGQRTGIALPGALEFARRDYALAFELAARTGVQLRIFGRSRDQGDGPPHPRDLDQDRLRMQETIASFAITDRVAVATDVSCREFYRTVERSRWVAVLPNQEDYLRGKLTGAVTAAVSCGVPMLASAACFEHYTRADPAVFATCMMAFEKDVMPLANSGGPCRPGVYEQLCMATIRARETLIAQNASVVERLLGRLLGR